MDLRSSQSHVPENGSARPWLASRTGLATLGGLAILAFLIATGHRAHLLGVLPYLLLLACPLMHVFMHSGHGSHGSKADAGHSHDHHDNSSRKE
jgi:hypothetical protein